MALLLGFLLLIIGVGLILLLILFIYQGEAIEPLFILCIAICAIISLCVGPYILSKN